MDQAFDVVKDFPVRKSRKQKQVFRQAVLSYAKGLGYSCQVEKGSLGCKNVVIGDPDRAKYLVTAHYDTCARMLIPNLLTPCSLWLFLGYQFILCLYLLLPSAAAGALVGYCFHDFFIGYWAFMVLLWTMIFLMLIGPANPSNVNDNTSGVISVLEIAKSIPEKNRRDVCFVLFDLEEAGLIGSASYRKAHKKTVGSQIVLNLDCVGDGDEIFLFPTSKLKKNPKKQAVLEKLTGEYGKKSITLRKEGFAIYPSDQANFPYGVGICALQRRRSTLYLSRIHTPRDTVLDENNVNILRGAIVSLIADSAAQ